MEDVLYLTPEELVERYRGRITARTLANWRGNGNGPAYLKAGGKVLYPYAAVIAWEAKRLIDVAQSICSALPISYVTYSIWHGLEYIIY